MMLITNMINIIITCFFIILVISERDNSKKLPRILCIISIVLTIINFVI